MTEIYSLPELFYVGGETIKLHFNLRNEAGGHFDAEGATVDFSICDYSDKSGVPILSYTPTILFDEQGIASILYLVIPKEDTVGLRGKYIYQITIVDASGEAEIPYQGIMKISRNIHMDFIG